MRVKKFFSNRNKDTEYISEIIDSIVTDIAPFWNYEELCFSIGFKKKDCISVLIDNYVKNRMDDSVKAIIIRNFFAKLNEKEGKIYELKIGKLFDAQKTMVEKGFGDLVIAHCFNYTLILENKNNPLHLAFFAASFTENSPERDTIIEIIKNNLGIKNMVEIDYHVDMFDNRSFDKMQTTRL